MANNIKGVTVKIGADTSDFNKSLKKLDKEINATSKTAKELNKSLALEFDEKRFLQAQKKAQQALSQTNEKAEAIRKQLKYLEENNAVDTDGYRKLEAELAKTEATAIKLDKQLTEINNIKMTNITNSIKNVSDGLGKAANATKGLSLAAVGAIAGTYKLAKETAAAGAELQDYSDRLNISAEALQRWQYVALQTGVESSQLTKAMAKSRDAIGTAMSGTTNSATKALEALFGDLSSLPKGTEAGFDAIVNALGKVEDSTMQAFYANEIFGERIATNLIPLFNNGAEKLAQLNGEFEAIGYLSNEQVKYLADFDDQLNIFNGQVKLAGAELGTALIPLLTELLDIFKETALPIIQSVTEWLTSLDESAQKNIISFTLFVAVLSPVLSILSKIVGIVPIAIKAFTALKGIITGTNLAMAGLIASLGVIVATFANWDKMTGMQRVIALIGGLTAAVLSAAVAFGVFHSTWSLGLAVAGIVAGITASVAAINAVKKEIEVPSDIPDYNAGDYTNAVTSNAPTAQNSGSNGSYYEDNSNYDININMTPTGELEYDSKALADEVIKQIILKKQAAGN